MKNEGFFLSNTFQEVDFAGVGGAHIVALDTVVRAHPDYTLQTNGTVLINTSGTYYLNYTSEAKGLTPANEYASYWEMQVNNTTVVGTDGQLVHISPQPWANHSKHAVCTLVRGDVVAIRASKSISPTSHLFSEPGGLTLFIAKL